MTSIVDIHAHISMRPLQNLHVTCATPAVLKAHAKTAGAKQVVILATRFPYKESGTSAKAITDAIGADPFFRVFGTVDASVPVTLETLDELDEQIATGTIVGLKLYPGYQRFDLSDHALDPLYALANEYHVPVMMHGGDLHRCCGQKDADRVRGVFRCGHTACPLIRDADLARPSRLGETAGRFPGLLFIIAHMGNPYFDETRAMMERYPNIMTDTSGQMRSGSVASRDPAYCARIVHEIEQTLRVPNGPERVLFGSDFPIQSYEDSLRFIERIQAPTHTKDLILYGNATHLLNLTET